MKREFHASVVDHIKHRRVMRVAGEEPGAPGVGGVGDSGTCARAGVTRVSAGRWPGYNAVPPVQVPNPVTVRTEEAASGLGRVTRLPCGKCVFLDGEAIQHKVGWSIVASGRL